MSLPPGPVGQVAFLLAPTASIAYCMFLSEHRRQPRPRTLAWAAACAVSSAVLSTTWLTATTALRQPDRALRLPDLFQHLGFAAVHALLMLLPRPGSTATGTGRAGPPAGTEWGCQRGPGMKKATAQ